MPVAKMACPSCGMYFDLDQLTLGQPLQCPGCHVALSLPHLATPANAPAGATNESEAGLLPGEVEALIGAKNSPPSRKKRNRAGLIWLISAVSASIVILSIVVAGAIVYHVSFSKNSTNRSRDASSDKPTEADSAVKNSGKADPPFDAWLQDMEAAKIRAKAEKKDLFLLFNASDWVPRAQNMTDGIFSKPAFRSALDPNFVLVYLDFPDRPSNRAKVADLRQNTRLQQEYQVTALPAVILCDADGNPFAVDGFSQETPSDYAARMVRTRQARSQRDRLFDAVGKAVGSGKAAAAAEALLFLADRNLAYYYKKQVQEWAEVVRQEDPRNDRGWAEVFFEADWFYELTPLDQTPPQELTRFAQRLDGWKKDHEFKDKNRAARIHLFAGELAARAGRRDAALKYALDGLAYRPDHSYLQQGLYRFASEMGLGSGSGFVVAPGIVMTNAHVVTGGKNIRVRLRSDQEPIAAKVLAEDSERDIALLQIDKALDLAPVALDGKRALERGEDVAALGYPLGELFGSGLKMTTGRVSATPEAGTNHMLLLENKINPGNSGGPLCDAHGNVVGMISAKTTNRPGQDSYGLALTGADLERFLRKNLKDYKPLPLETKNLTWPEVNRKVSPAVLMVLRMP